MSIFEKIRESFIQVDGGFFLMGDNFGDGYEDEKPVHEVTLDPFCIFKYHISQEIWEFVMNNNPSSFRGKDKPVDSVSWLSCIDFCNRLSILNSLEPCYIIKENNVEYDFTKNGYRLPTEAEWEFSAKGGVKSKKYLYSGSNLIEKVAWYKNNSNNMSHTVGSKDPNEIGIYDMSGNLWEWCWDFWGLHSPEHQKNPTGPVQGIERVIRGGTWYQDSYYLRTSHRYRQKPTTEFYGIGFRIAKNI